MITIVHVLQSPDGGGPRQALELARDARRRGYHAVVAAPGNVPAADGIDVRHLPTGRIRRAAVLWRLAREADILHVHGTRAAAWTLPLFPLTRTVVTFHGLHPVRRPAGVAYRLAARMFVRTVAKLADASIAVSQSEAAELGKLAPPGKVHVVRNAVPPRSAPTVEDRSSVREELGLNDATLVLLFLGRLEPAKRSLDAIRAVEGVDGIELLVAGDGPMRTDVVRAGGPSVRLLGWRLDPERLLAASDVVLNTSHWEGLPLTVLEAMWAGRPVVASRVAGNVEALGDAGILVELGDVSGIRSAITALREDPGERARLAMRGRERVLRLFDYPAMLDQTDAVYRSVLQAG